MVKNTYGTGCFMLMNTGAKPIASKNNLLTTVAWRIGKRTEYALEGSIFIAGAVVQWLRDGLGIIQSSREVEALAAQVPDTRRRLSRAGLRRTRRAALGSVRARHHRRPHARQHAARTSPAPRWRASPSRSRMCSSAMEADAGSSSRNCASMAAPAPTICSCSSRPTSSACPVVRPRVAETTALGAAYLAGLAVGFWKDQTDIALQWQVDRIFRPTIKPAVRKTLIDGWNRALERAKG